MPRKKKTALCTENKRRKESNNNIARRRHRSQGSSDWELVRKKGLEGVVTKARGGAQIRRNLAWESGAMRLLMLPATKTAYFEKKKGAIMQVQMGTQSSRVTPPRMLSVAYADN